MELSSCRRHRTPRAANSCPQKGVYMDVKNIICTAAGLAGAGLSAIFGGWSGALTTLVIFMAIDYVTGIISAGVFHASTKTDSGRLESRAGWKGLIRKGAILAVVLISHRMDMLMQTESLIKDGAVIAFCTNELISIIENMGHMGVPIPKVLADMIEKMKDKEAE